MNKKSERIIFGLLLVIAAGIIVGGKLGWLGEVNVLSIVLTVFIVYIIIKSVYPVRFGGILFPIAFLGILYDKQLGIESLTPWTILIVATLATIGLSLIFKHNRFKKIDEAFSSYDKNCCRGEQTVINSDDASYVHHKTSFGATAKYINCNDFKGADLDCSFGAMTVYFDNAKITGENAVVNLHVSFAGVELYIPKEWNVTNNIQESLGAVECKNMNKPDGTATLVLEGSVSFGGIDIIYI